jgi:AcrR family transcriptional regulator
MSGRKPSPPPPTASGESLAPSAPQRILDAAEAVFARQGYYGATIRDITDAAGVPLSLARYHFGSKDDLFKQVLGRRAQETCDQLDASLARAVAATTSREQRLQAVVDAMVSVPVERLAGGDLGWRHYLQLLAHINQLIDRPELLQPFRAAYAGTVQRYRQALRNALPDAPEATLNWSLHFLQILVGHAILDLVVTRWMAGTPSRPDDWTELRRHLVAHVVGGIRAQLALAPEATGAPRPQGRKGRNAVVPSA